MKGLYKRIIAGAFSLVILFLACIPCAYASGADVGVSVDLTNVDFWDWLISMGYSNTVNPFLSIFDKNACPHCPDVTRRHNFKEQHTTVDGKTGLFYICEYCGKSAGEVGEEAYQQQVESLPATGYTSAGKLLWQPTVSDVKIAYANSSSCFPNSTAYNRFEALSSGLGIYRSNRSGSSETMQFEFYAPVYGVYFVTESPSCEYYLITSSGETKSGIFNYSTSVHNVSGNDSSSFYIHTDIYSVYFGDYGHYLSTKWYFPIFEIVPIDDDFHTSSYHINTRPTTITGGNYGIVGDDGQIITVNNQNKIVNETNNIYYNPATGESTPIVNWTYDYGDRTYTLDLEGNVTVDVRYGDDNITITENNVVEGDTIVNNYIIYYMIDGSTPVCAHTWQAGESTAPTCISPGKTFNTCTKCGASSVDIIPALGHDWQVLRTVQTEYDEDGNLVQGGYTIYQCSRCNEQYKDVDSTGPPPSRPGSGSTMDDGGLLEFLNGIIKHLSDNLSGAVALLRRFFSEIPGLFSGFTEFLAAVFPFLPGEIMLLLTFGMAALVFVGIIKKIRR